MASLNPRRKQIGADWRTVLALLIFLCLSSIAFQTLKLSPWSRVGWILDIKSLSVVNMALKWKTEGYSYIYRSQTHILQELLLWYFWFLNFTLLVPIPVFTVYYNFLLCIITFCFTWNLHDVCCIWGSHLNTYYEF